ncbi:hypothetical protein DFH09DRAFT_1080600 [Mycena vulgaris]|nr:hypothetical protein DFH09DRAFT_1080600 [Mycena vulgaris]
MFAPTIYNKAPYIPSVGDHALVIIAIDTIAVDYASLPVLPEIEELKKFIESDSQICSWTTMVPNYQRMLQILNKWLQQSPVYFEIDDSPTLVLRSTNRIRWVNVGRQEKERHTKCLLVQCPAEYSNRGIPHSCPRDLKSWNVGCRSKVGPVTWRKVYPELVRQGTLGSRIHR